MATVRASPLAALPLLLAVAGVAEVAGGLAPGSAGALCCDHSKDNQMCHDVCEQIFSSKSESRLKHLLQRAPDYCPETMVEIWSCMNSSLPGVFKKSDGWVGLGCCELAITLECRQACKQASSKNDISKVCRKEYENALFSCISRNEMGSVCCSYAGHHTNCREYCQAIFRTDSSPGPSQIKAVENYCASISPQLIHCVNNYTQSYPMRNPTDSLYCCDRAEDHACQSACKRILMSKKTEMEIVDGLIEGCKTQPLPQDPLWQCFLESSQSVHPGVTLHPPPSTGLDGAKLHCCSKANTSTCRSDCVEILKKCGDQNKFPEDHTAESICELLSPTDDLESCIPLDTYLRPSTLGNIVEEVTHPCNPNPCPANELCEVNRKGCPSGDPCLPYSCVQGCKLGEASDFIVRQGTLIQVPSSAGSEVGCYKICSCGHSGLLENCMEMHCIDLQKSCIVGGKRKSHGTSFNVDCNVCSCFAGNLVCSTRLCLSEHSSEDDRRTFTGLPCNCADQFVPVCGQNGRTYPSACIARCVGLQDQQFEFGSCISKDPCNPNPCPKNQRCIPKPQVCLTTFDKFGCSQFECLPRQLTCDQVRDPVCDTNHMEHSNLCTLYQRGKSLLYKGPCQPFCRATEPVCGHNGETYSSVCAAYSDRVAVDYYGPCQAVGVLSEHSSVTECAAVRCPSLSAAECKPIVPPGACCPLCAGMLRVLFDKEKLDTIAKVTNKKPITVLDILQKIRMHVSVPQCDVFGYFSIESEIVILIIPVDHYPKALQIEACNKEAEKIESLINSDSPTLASHVPLSALIISQVQVSSSVPSAGVLAGAPCHSCLFLLTLGFALHIV
ncbi:reversion-inducing cysteine-rich protein with Kazal motifs isoform X3 [Eptesicus fuscus]|uniref:reversion-inducing cysteine-rich protein with Kazal motifs isoform X3 n=1 Tax=Eptesicus fuscus TaxID=29078 RepID=UPI002403A940|nr:reversion-inducing cysteine-rich protein with Kazal motifs isoform X3 [Eptesicus fuscus]